MEDTGAAAWEGLVVEHLMRGLDLLTIQIVECQWTSRQDKLIMTRTGIVLMLVTRGRGALNKTSKGGACKLAMASLLFLHSLHFSVSVHLDLYYRIILWYIEFYTFPNFFKVQ